MVVGLHVQTPQQFFLPRGQRARTDGLDVHERQQAEHLEELFGADQMRELRDDVRVVEIAPEGDLRHREMVADEELVVCRASAAISRRSSAVLPSARSPRMIGLGGLADVVQDQRQRQHFRRPQLLEQPPEALAPGSLRVPQRLDSADGQQRVLVHRVLVVEVTNHPAVDALELRQDAVEQPAVVHLREPGVQPGTRMEQGAKLLPLSFRAGEVVGAVARQVLLDAVEGLLRDRAAVGERQPENLDPQRGPGGRALEVQEADAVTGDLEMTPDARGGLAFGRGPRRAGFRPQSRITVLDRLDRDGPLPAITFVFSRAGCDAVAQCVRAERRCWCWCSRTASAPPVRPRVRR